MVKKIGSLGLIVGGILGMIGGIMVFVKMGQLGSGSLIGAAFSANEATKMAVLARVGAIIMFVAAIIAIAGVCMANIKKGGAVASLIFGIIAFIGQFLINPITSLDSAIFAGAEQIGGAAFGTVLIIVSGLVLAILGLVGLLSKNKTVSYTGSSQQ